MKMATNIILFIGFFLLFFTLFDLASSVPEPGLRALARGLIVGVFFQTYATWDVWKVRR